MKDLIKKIDWEKGGGLVPAIIQDNATGAVLMLGYMNGESLTKTLKTKKVWFYSRSRSRLWMKGETSGNFLKLTEIKFDCDSDALLIKAQPAGPICHTGDYSCFQDRKTIDELSSLFETIIDRKNKMPQGSYTASLFRAGLNKISLKVAEEALEVIQAAQKETKLRLTEETADLIYHLFVLLAEKKVNLSDVETQIKKRQKPTPFLDKDKNRL